MTSQPHDNVWSLERKNETDSELVPDLATMDINEEPIEVLWVNDLHGNYLDPNSRTPSVYRFLDEKRKTLTKRHLVFGGGDDHAGGSLWDVLIDERSGGSPVYPLMEEFSMDAFVPGNHDLDFGEQVFCENLKSLTNTIPLLSNAKSDTLLSKHVSKALIYQFGNYHVGVLGFLTADQTLNAGSLLSDPLETYKSLRSELDKFAHCWIILSHLGWNRSHQNLDDKRFLPYLGPKDLLLGAHTHDVIPSSGRKGSCYLQSGQKGLYYGKASLDKGYNNWITQNFPIDKQTNDLSKVEASAQQKWKEKVSLLGYIQLKDVLEKTDNKTAYRKPSIWMNWVSDALLEAGNSYREDQKDLLDAETATLNVGGACVRLLGTIKEGHYYSIMDWYRLIPYPDRLGWIFFKKEQLAKFMRINCYRFLESEGYQEDFGLIHFSKEITYKFRFEANNLVDLNIYLNGVPLDSSPYEFVRFWTHSYVSEGFGGYRQVMERSGIDWDALPKGSCPLNFRNFLWKKIKEHGMNVDTKARFEWL